MVMFWLSIYRFANTLGIETLVQGTKIKCVYVKNQCSAAWLIYDDNVCCPFKVVNAFRKELTCHVFTEQATKVKGTDQALYILCSSNFLLNRVGLLIMESYSEVQSSLLFSRWLW